MTEDFMASTLDIWSIPPESARRVGHPAPFPVELPEQLIRLYTFTNDLVLDPFMGSGSALVASARLGRRYVGYDLDETYVEIARRRVEESVAPPTNVDDLRDGATGEGKAAHLIAEQVLTDAGFTITGRKRRIPKTGVTVDFTATTPPDEDVTWFFDVSGPFTSHHGGLLRTDMVWKALGRAHALRGRLGQVPLLLLTTHLPHRTSEGDTALRAAGPDAFFDVIELLSDEGRDRLARYAKAGFENLPQPGFWTPGDLASRRAR